MPTVTLMPKMALLYQTDEEVENLIDLVCQALDEQLTNVDKWPNDVLYSNIDEINPENRALPTEMRVLIDRTTDDCIIGFADEMHSDLETRWQRRRDGVSIPT